MPPAVRMRGSNRALTSRSSAGRAAAGTAVRNGWANTSSQCTMSPESGVGRGKRRIDATEKPQRSSRRRYASDVGKVPGVDRGAVDAALGERGGQSLPDRRHVAVAAELSHEPAAWLQRPPDALQQALDVANPVQHRVAEDRIEFGVEREFLGIDDPGVEPALECGPDLFGAAVDGDDAASRLPETFGQGAVAASQVENALARPRIQQVADRRTEVRDEAAVLSVCLRVPVLGHRAAFATLPGPSGR